MPDGQWSTWVILGGRGAGKTRVGAEWVGMSAAMAPMGSGDRSLVAAPTKGDLRKTCFQGESGLIAKIPSSLIKRYNKTPDPEIELHNGSLIGGIAAENPERFRGPNWHRGWADEVAAWGESGRCDPAEAWSNMELSIRLGQDTRILATTTPKNRPHLKAILAEKGTVVTMASTHVNLANLSPEFARRILKYDGTKIGRQEIYAELIDSEDGGIISRSWFRLWPSGKPFPRFEKIVMSLDTAYGDKDFDKKKREPDPSACTVWGCFRLPNGKPAVMLLDAWHGHYKYPELVEKVSKERLFKYGQTDRRPVIAPQRGPTATMGVGKSIDVILIEEKASGKSLRQSLAADGIPTYGFNPGNADKTSRTHIVSPIPKDGIVWVPESQAKPGKIITWAEPWAEEVCSFSGPGTTLHDDYLDTTTQAWRMIDWTWLHHLENQSKMGKHLKGPDEQSRESRTNERGHLVDNPYAA